MVTKKIEKRRKEEKSLLGRIERENDIGSILNSCFKKGSLDEEDQESILRWACNSVPTKDLIFLFEKIKFERLKR